MLESDHGGIERLKIPGSSFNNFSLESDHGGIERACKPTNLCNPHQRLESDHGGIERKRTQFMNLRLL